MLNRTSPASVSLLLMLLASYASVAAAQDAPLPEGDGLAAKYPGDAGLARDPAVLLFDDFETGDVAQLTQRWTEVSNKDNKVVAFADGDAPAGSRGSRCLRLTATVTQNTGGHLYRKLPREVDRAFARFYVKFPRDAGYIHHFVHIGGYRPATNWPQGGAGERPRGDERFTIGIEPFGRNGQLAAPGAWNFYAYWHEMKVSAGGRYWGNAISPAQPLLVPRDTWQCVEIMVQCNTPGVRNGELALWLDGKLTMHVRAGTPRGQWTGMGFIVHDRNDAEETEPFEGFSFRRDERLKVNFFWLLHYVTPEALKRNGVADLSKPVSVWFDQIVVAESYIGPVKAGR